MLNRREILFILIAFFSSAVYMGFSVARGAPGFPLDDAWIHQVYARNIGTHGEFAFFSGQPSAGSTSPLWTILLGLGYLLRVDYRVWAYLLGALLLGASSILVGRLAARASLAPRFAIFVSLFMLFEWHLVWSAVSGMEIPLFVFFSLLLVERYGARERVWVLGLIAGLLSLTRPEGGVLAGLIGIGMILPQGRGRGFAADWVRKVGEIGLYILAFAILVAPYLIFNLATTSAILPNTFYAKNAEYAILIEQTPFVVRLAQTLAAPWIGAQLLLLPGFIVLVAENVSRRDWRALIPVAWILALAALYALRLPVTYQHGRYEMPLVPFMALYGFWGTMELLALARNFVVRMTWGISVAAALAIFWVSGAIAYSTDVDFINCEMVQTAHWVAQNIPGERVIAAHDIGALGYFYPRPFTDLAGLVSPEVISFIRDDRRLRDLLVSRRTDFVIVFPDWYDSLTRDLDPVFQTNCSATRAAGGSNLTVYHFK